MLKNASPNPKSEIRNPQSEILMRVLGIDCGSRVTGYGVIDSDGSDCFLVQCGAIRVNPAEPLPLRLKSIYTGIVEVIHELKPDVAAFENLFYASNAQSALKLGHVRGVSMFAAAEASLPVFEYSPLEVKSAVTGYGRAEKNQVQQMVRVLLKLKAAPEPYDASDALAVAICHAHTIQYGKLGARSQKPQVAPL
jgi:crossover junction endodeoxyribonuclease RuvC